MANSKRPGVIVEKIEQAPAPPQPPAKEKEPPASPTEIDGFVFSRTREVDHHVAKLEAAMDTVNKSFVLGGYLPFEVEHGHIFHNVDSKGRTFEYCAPMMGHYHKVTMEVVNGKPTFTCGPAMVKANVKTGNGGRKVAYLPKQNLAAVMENGMEVQAAQIDTHTHKITYKRSEKLSIKA